MTQRFWYLLLSCALLLALNAAHVGGAHAQADDSAALVAGNTQFALDLYQRLRGNDGNLVFSPYSISQALAMTYAGAGGTTAQQMADVLRFTLPPDALHAALGALNADLTARGSGDADPDGMYPAYLLRVANALWGEQTYPFNPPFLDLVNQHYGAGFQLTDFIGAPDAARQQINDWVAGQTQDRIRDIVPEGALDSLTRLVLANAIYFNNAWLFPFLEELTADADFTLADGSTVSVPFMNMQDSLRYASGDGYQAVSLPFAGDDTRMSMLFVVPDDFAAFEDALTPETLDGVLAALTYGRVTLALPRFEFTTDLALSDTLRAMGMTDAFDASAADFSGMSDADDLFISAVLHKAFIAVAEDGVEAAAATVVIMATSAMPIDEPVVIRFDRPFLFALRDDLTGTLLFVGRVMNPAGA